MPANPQIIRRPVGDRTLDRDWLKHWPEDWESFAPGMLAAFRDFREAEHKRIQFEHYPWLLELSKTSLEIEIDRMRERNRFYIVPLRGAS